jgi:hypothetical protein
MVGLDSFSLGMDSISNAFMTASIHADSQENP